MLSVWICKGILQKFQQQCIQTTCDCDLFEAESQTDEGDRILYRHRISCSSKAGSFWMMFVNQVKNFIFCTWWGLRQLWTQSHLSHSSITCTTWETVTVYRLTIFLFSNKWQSSGRFASQDIRSSYLSIFSFQWAKSFRRLFSSEETLSKNQF